MKQFLQRLQDACFPISCIQCQCDGHLWCQTCRTGFLLRTQQACPSCDTVTCFGAACVRHRGGAVDGVVSATWYANRIPQQLVRAWKYQGIREAEEGIGWILDRWADQELLPNGTWTIVPIPLHPRKARLRGFDQGARLGEVMSCSLGIPVASCLQRVRMGAGKPQAQTPLEQRRKRDFRGVFAVRGTVPQDVLLVDDVYTTGTTMSAAAAVLKAAGVTRVWGCVFARG